MSLPPLSIHLDSPSAGESGHKSGGCESPGQACGGPYAVASAWPNPTLSYTQLTIEKLISKGRVLTMANQVLAVNISEEVSSTNKIWNEWTNGGAGDDWPVV